MSAKKLKKYGDIAVPAQSLQPVDFEGWLTKQGGSIKTWKKRWVILKDRTLYYYKTNKDQVFTGKIDLEPTSLVKEEPDKKKHNLFSITTAKRIYSMYPDTPDQVKLWVDAILRGIEKAKGGSGGAPKNEPIQGSGSASSGAATVTKAAPQSTPTAPQEPTEPAKPQFKGANQVAPSGEMSPRVRLSLAKGVIGFLKDEDSKVLEFWQIWSESIPPREDISPGFSIDFTVATSADMQKLTWRTSGPQSIFIQKMVDFFWNVGAPESEIDRLNDVGALINPVRIGSWIDMSSKGGMDGGWFFPTEIPLKLAIEACDPGDASKKLSDWAEEFNIISVFAVGRDMGAAPPRQTEIRLKVPGETAEEQIQNGTGAFEAFGFPAIPDEALKILHSSRPGPGLCLSVITSSEGFVRLGLLVPKPNTETVLALCSIAGGNNDEMAAFEGSLGTDGPAFAEYQYLNKSFGYGVYKEGFDVVFHYQVGEEALE